MIPIKEFENRINRIRSEMKKSGMDAILVTDPKNYFYFTGHKVPVWMKSRASIFLIPLEGDPVLISWYGPDMFSRLYGKKFPSWVEDRRIYYDVPFDDKEYTDWGVVDLIKEKGLSQAVIGIEHGKESWLGITYYDYKYIEESLPNVQFVNSSHAVWACRMIKTEWEIDCLRQACYLGGKAWDKVIAETRVGDSVRDVQEKILHYYAQENVDIDSGLPMVLGATGEKNTFQYGDVLYLDGGPSFNNYKMDYTRRAVFGDPSPRQIKEHSVMWEILFKIIKEMKPGVKVKDLFDYSQGLLSEHPDLINYSKHPSLRIGHGIGLENEPPSMSGTDNTILMENMVLTPEPKIESVDGLVNPEEQVVIRANEPEILSDSSDYRLRVIG